MRVLIAGAGIGGLTAALALHAAGIEATVVERAREIRPLGVGINLLPHAVRELVDLGLGDELAGIAVATARHVYCDRSGRRLFTEPRGLAGGYRWPQYSVHRGRLQMLLLAAARDRLGQDAVRTGARLLRFEQDAHAVRAEVTDLERGTAELTAAVLVGADGLHSAVRAQLHPDQGPLLWSGVRMWRGVTETAPFLDGRSVALAGDGAADERGAGDAPPAPGPREAAPGAPSAGHTAPAPGSPAAPGGPAAGSATPDPATGSASPAAGAPGGASEVPDPGAAGAELVAYPLGPALVNWVALVPVGAPGPLPGDARWNRPGRAADVLPYYADWDLGWLDVPVLIAGSETILEYPMVDRDPLPWWGEGRVTLLGDAAHPMYPTGANGASQAIVDARALADALARDLPGGLAGYESARRPDTAAVVDANRALQRTRNVRSTRELARITRTYRRATRADAHRAGP